MNKAARITSTDYRHPYRPLPVAIVNRCGTWLQRFGLRATLAPGALVSDARRKTGLREFGEPGFLQRLERLTSALESEAHLHPLGRLMVSRNLVRILANRLRIEDALQRLPRIEALPMEDPIVVVGLQRTGTTVMHRLLASDPARRILASWEAVNPAPDRARTNGGLDPRIRTARLAQKGLAYLAPDFFAIHPVEALEPEEDCLLFDFTLLSTVPEATQRIPSFSAWLEEQDHTQAYRYVRKILQYLQLQRPGGRWVLKSPQHLENLEALLAVFPRARIIQTHRDPVRVLASFCSMMSHARGVFSDRVDPREVGRHWFRKARRMIDRCARVRSGRLADRFLDVHYARLVDDPIGQVRRVYGCEGMQLTTEAERRMRSWLAGNPQHKHGRHRYRLEDFGLTREEVEEAFAGYRRQYGIPRGD